jgi:hypothetical protein
MDAHIFVPLKTIENVSLKPEFIVCNVVWNAVAVLERVPPYFRKSRADAAGATAPLFLATTLAVS